MNIYKPSQIPKHGRMICIYGPSGVGKTISTLISSPKKLLWLVTEPRDLAGPIATAGLKEEDIDIAPYDNILDVLDFLSDAKKFSSYSTVFFDSLTYTMNIQLSREVTEEHMEKKTKGDTAKIEKPIAMMMKKNVENVGVINTSVFRLLNLLGEIAASGKIIIISCLEAESPKWNRELAAAPALSGLEVPKSFPGFFDLIGYVFPRTDETLGIVYPPIISFESDGSYMAKFCGVGKARMGVLDWSKILK